MLGLSVTTWLALAACLMATGALFLSFFAYQSLGTRWSAVESVVLFGDAARDAQVTPQRRKEARDALLSLALAFASSKDHRIKNPVVARVIEAVVEEAGQFAESKGELRREAKRDWIKLVKEQTARMRPSTSTLPFPAPAAVTKELHAKQA